MPGNRDLDFTPVVTHTLFLVTFILAGAGWLTAFISQAALQAQSAAASFSFGGTSVNLGSLGIASNPVGTLWFGIFLHAAVIGLVLWTLATDSIALNRLQVAVFSGVSIIYAVQGADLGLFSPSAAGKAMGAGYLILSFVFIIWTIFFTSEEGSLTLDLMNTFGTGGLTGPGRRRTVIGGQGIARSTSNGMNGGYSAPPPASYGSPTTGVPHGYGGYGGNPIKEEASMKSQHSLGVTNAQNPSVTGFKQPTPSIQAQNTGPAYSDGRAPSPAVNNNASLEPSNVPLVAMPSPGQTSGTGTGGDTEQFSYRAKALYTYNASPDDPTELSFTKGEILDILDNSGKWWHAKKADGVTGIAPSNYLQIV